MWSSGSVHYLHLCSANKVEPTLVLKPRRNITRNPKQGTSGPKIGHMNVSDKNKKATKTLLRYLTYK